MACWRPSRRSSRHATGRCFKACGWTRSSSKPLRQSAEGSDAEVRLGTETTGCQQVLRFRATTGQEKYMSCVGALEQVEPLCGQLQAWRDIFSGQELAQELEPEVRARRARARRAGSTYAPEFLGLLEVALVKQWSLRQKKVPRTVLKASELLLNVNDQPHGSVVLRFECEDRGGGGEEAAGGDRHAGVAPAAPHASGLAP